MNIPADSIPCLVFSFNDGGMICGQNRAFHISLQFEEDELEGKSIECVMPVASRIFYQTHLFPLLKMQGLAYEIFLSLRKKDGQELPVLINAERKEIDGEMISVCSGMVVRNRQKFENELLAAKKAAERALADNSALMQMKMQLQKHVDELNRQNHLTSRQRSELSQFSKVVSHDLQEPLRKLIMFSDLLVHGKYDDNPEPVIKKLARISEQMRSIVSGLQQYVWLTDNEMTTAQVNLHSILLAARQKVLASNPGVDIELEKTSLPNIEADREQIELLFFEVLDNAVRFRKNEQTTRIHVTGNVLQLNKYRNLESSYQYIDFLRLQIHDDGEGIEPEYKDQLFGLFKRLHPKSGRGVGLSLCQKVIENHQGTITIDGRLGEGTTVTILLPISQKELAGTQTAAAFSGDKIEKVENDDR